MTDILKQKTKIIVMHRNTSYALAVLIFGCLVFYVYFANTAVRTLTVLEKIREEIQSLSIGVSEMESKRFVIDNSVNPDLARHLGFIEVNQPTFIMKNTSQNTLSFKTN